MAITTESAFLIFGGILIIGYFGELLAKKFSVPSALLLLLIGYLLKFTGYVEIESIVGIQDLFGSLALIVLLFDGGLTLNLREVLFKSGRVLLLAFLTTVVAIILSIALFNFLGINPIIGAIFGAIAGGIGSTTTISIASSLKLPDRIKNFLTLESSITDVFSIILTIVLTQTLLSGSIDFQIISQGIASRFSTGLIIGAVTGIISLAILSKIQKGYNYMVTFAIVLILYAVTEFLAGSGAIAVLVFGLLFGNENAIRNALKLDINAGKRPIIKQFQNEISFFIRTFFFVFLGIVVQIGNLNTLMIAVYLLVILYITRYLCVNIANYKDPVSEFNKILIAINPRGLATAVLATYPVIAVQNAMKTSPNGFLKIISEQIATLPEIAFYTIVLSIVFTTILVPFAMNGKGLKKNVK
ncbi:MAG: cation:proton antiporter [Candidatus Micrarchaeota archaeon]